MKEQIVRLLSYLAIGGHCRLPDLSRPWWQSETSTAGGRGVCVWVGGVGVGVGVCGLVGKGGGGLLALIQAISDGSGGEGEVMG